MKIGDSSGSAIKLLILLSVILVFASIYKRSIPSYLQSPALWALHWISIFVVFIGIIAVIWIVLDIFVIDHEFGGSERNL